MARAESVGAAPEGVLAAGMRWAAAITISSAMQIAMATANPTARRGHGTVGCDDCAAKRASRLRPEH
ncbi:MAG: hypothetical protein ABSA32_08900 [Candidatus Acidiferrales bacterium]